MSNELINVDYLIKNKQEFKRFIRRAVDNALCEIKRKNIPEIEYRDNFIDSILNYIYFLKGRELNYM